MDRNLLDLGFIQIKWYSFLILLAIMVAALIVSKEAKKKNLNENAFLDMAFYGLII